MNKVIAAMMMMAITTTMPAMAGNKKHTNHDKKDKVVAVNYGKKESHFDKVDKRPHTSMPTRRIPTVLT